MKKSTPDFPTLTAKQREFLEELEAEIGNLKKLLPGDPKTGIQAPEFYQIQERIDELSVKILRFALKPLPAESRRPGFFLESYYHKGHLVATGDEIKPAFGDFHPDLPPWAKDHFVGWIRVIKLRRADAREVLRETKIVGIETGMKRPEDMTLLIRVLGVAWF